VRRFLILALALAACSPAGDDRLDVSAPLMLSPDAEIADATENAAAAWSGATGIQIVLGSGGVAMRVVDDLDACGRTTTLRRASGRLVRVDTIEIRRALGHDCMRRPGTLRHELGHALQQWGSRDDFPPDEDGHSDEGLMDAQASSIQVVDEPALELVCAAAPCTRFESEAP
jgi:hypothetical protein